MRSVYNQRERAAHLNWRHLIMLVKQEQLNPCEVELEVEVAAEQVKSAIDSTYKELGKTANVPGFRKGKAPRIVLEQFLDTEAVKERAANKLIKGAYTEALEESKLDPFAPADVELVKFESGEPMVFKARVPLPPKVELGDYVGLEIERNVPPVTDEHVDAEINRILERAAEVQKIEDRPAQMGDVVLVEMKDETKPDEQPSRQVAELGKNLPDFDNGVVGMAIEDEKVIDVNYPEDHNDEELRGKTIPLRVKLIEINVRNLPELNDEWVKKMFAPEKPETEQQEDAPAAEKADPPADVVDTVDKLKGKIREAMEHAARDTADAQVKEDLVRKVVENAQVHFPDVMVDEAVGERMETLLDELKTRKATLDDYLQYVGKSLDELKKEFEDESKQALNVTLVLREIMDKEKVEVSDEDVSAEIESMAADRGVPQETMRAYVDRTDSTPSIRNRVLRKKIVDFLVHASNIKNVAN